MATTEVIGARTYEADRRTMAVLREVAPESAERITQTLGDPLPAYHQPEHQLFISEATAALAEAVREKVASSAKKKRGRPPKEEAG